MIPMKPVNVIWSDEQWQAIYDEGKNILVSAGAGSGKTTVLTARVIEKLKKGVSLKNLIVLTFTEAAASEMKERIRKEIKKEIDKNSSFIEEYNYIDQANIQTFDSFNLELVRKYHYALKINRDLSICDAALLNVTKRKILDEIFKEYYEKRDEDFINLVKFYSLKDDDSLKESILKVDEALDLLSNREEYLKSYQNTFLTRYFLENKKEEFLVELKKSIKDIKNNLNNIKQLDSSNEFQEGVKKIEEAISSIFKAETYDDFHNLAIGTIRLPNKLDDESKKILLAEKEVIQDAIKKIKKCAEINSIDEQIDLILSNKQYIITIIKVINDLTIRVNAFKEKYNLYSFMDISKMAIKLLQDNKEICDSIKYNTNEIMVDEYQDTSDIQELMISLISNNNVYMVGDIKQSIYRFRNANPDIFSSKYINYKYGDTNDTVIDLSKNFRSREEVLKNINLLFSKVMDIEFGGADYNDGHALIFGNEKYSEYQTENNNFEIYYYDEQEDLAEYKKFEIEAMIIAKDILHKINSGYKVLVGDKMEEVSYKDFCILSSSKTHFEAFKKVFESYGIPLVIHKDEMFISSDEVVAVLNLLRLVALFNKKDFKNDFKYSLMSVLRSFIYGDVNDNQIADIVLNHDIINALENSNIGIYESLVRIDNVFSLLTLSDLVDMIFDEFDIYGKIYKMKNIEGVENRLGFLVSKANEFSKIGYDIWNFMDYINGVRNNKIDITLKSNSDISGNVVNIMSIHKSKGLEFNICYFPLLDAPFKLNELKEKILFTKDLGVIFPVFNEGMQDSFLKELLRIRLLKAEISEKIRLLYVALTRAKDKFILISKRLDSVNSNNSYGPLSKSLYNSFYDIILSLNQFITLYKKFVIVDSNTLAVENKKIVPTNEKIIFKDLHFDKEIVERKKASITNNKMLSKEEASKMEFGTTIHKYFEYIDFNNYQNDIGKLNINDFYKNKIRKFYENIKSLNLEIVNIFHEYEFVYQENNERFNGIIDLLIETKAEFIIIDYKLSDITKDGYIKQLEVYKNYISLISAKKVECYLYSVLEEKLSKV